MYGLGRTAAQVKQTYEARRAALARHPIRLSDGSPLTPAAYDSAIASALYWTGSYVDIGDVLRIVEHYAAATPDERAVAVGWFALYHTDSGDNTFYNVICRDTAKLQNDADPATPFVDALHAHRATPGSVMVTVEDQPDHTIYGSGLPCVERIANDWLIRAELPRRDVSSQGVDLPNPSDSPEQASAITSA